MPVLLIGVFVAVLIGAFVAMAYRRGWGWTGIPADRGDGTPAAPPRPAKTLWDWLQLLVIPLVLAIAAFALNTTQAERERKREDRRATLDRAIAEDRAREDTLRIYLQQMSDLMTKGGLLSARSRASHSGVEELARTLTLTALRRLDRNRKELVVQFLSEANLITVKKTWTPTSQGHRPADTRSLQLKPFRGPRVSLAGADLRGVVLHRLPWQWRYNGGTQWTVGPDLDQADLRHADFRGAQLTGLSLDNARLDGADFSGAVLSGTSFHHACLSGARFARASQLADLEIPPDFASSEGQTVDFTHADISHASFQGANLADVNLRGATTSGVVWPATWTSTGIRMSNDQRARLCALITP